MGFQYRYAFKLKGQEKIFWVYAESRKEATEKMKDWGYTNFVLLRREPF